MFVFPSSAEGGKEKNQTSKETKITSKMYVFMQSAWQHGDGSIVRVLSAAKKSDAKNGGHDRWKKSPRRGSRAE